MCDKCVKCGKPMSQRDIEQSKMGAEHANDIICDKCFDIVTLEIAKGAFPNAFKETNTETATRRGYHVYVGREANDV